MSGGGCCRGPGYATPMDAFKNSKKEKLLYLPCLIPTKDRPDYLATVDVDETSSDFGKVFQMEYTSRHLVISSSFIMVIIFGS